MTGKGYGPLHIAGPGSSVLVMKCASADARSMPWPIVGRARPHGNDFLYTIWEFSALYPFWMDRVRVRPSLKDHLHSLHLPTPACSIVRVSCAAEVGSVRRWLPRT
eukprot:9485912-Pyramimonas_sp.AAC.2